MEQKDFSTKVREIVSNVSLRPKSYGVIPQSTTDESVLVVTNSTCLDDMEEVAKMLCCEDFLVKYMSGNNFLVVEPNPFPTSEFVPGKISRIPISFEEALEKLKSYSKYVAVCSSKTANSATIVAKQSEIRAIFSEISLMLSASGLYVNYVEGCNFLEIEDTYKGLNIEPVAVPA